MEKQNAKPAAPKMTAQAASRTDDGELSEQDLERVAAGTLSTCPRPSNEMPIKGSR